MSWERGEKATKYLKNTRVAEPGMKSQHAAWMGFAFEPETVELTFLLNKTGPNG